jgi:hypothetical protein
MEQFGSQDARAGRIREWLLLLLRFAITRDPKDEAGVIAMADEIDALGLQWRPSAPSFFRRRSSEVCKMITALDDPRRATVLKRHIARIDDPRLRHAFQAAVDIEVNHRSCERGVAAPKSKGPQLALRPPDGKGGAGSPP